MTRRMLTALVLLFGLAAAACSSTEGTTTSTTDPASGSAAAGETDRAASPSESSEVVGGELSERVRSQVGNWNTDFSNTTIDLGTLASGIGGDDPRDVIRPIDEPTYESTDDASSWLVDGDPGALVVVDDIARFYPLSIMTRHEIVNTAYGDVPVAVTYCPLCNTAVAFDRRVGDQTVRLGVSGLLRQSDMVMWDDLTDSLWQQITGEGIVGEFAGTKLETVTTALVAFSDFRAEYPDGESLSRDSGGGGTYGVNPYVGYSSQSAPIDTFVHKELDPRYPALSRVVGIQLDGTNKAYPFEVLQASNTINDTIGDQPVAILWTPGSLDALDAGSIAASQEVGTGIAFDPTVNGDVLTFTGSDGVFTDDQTGSTWTGLGRATAGELAGAELEILDHRNEFWFAWAGFFGETGTVFTG